MAEIAERLAGARDATGEWLPAKTGGDSELCWYAPQDIAWLFGVVERQQVWIRKAEERMQYMSDSLRSDVL